MNKEFKLKPEDLKKVTGGELDKDNIEALNEFIIWSKDNGYSKDDFLVEMVNLGFSGEALWYVGTHWEEINR